MPMISVVKYDGTPDVFAWKFPDEELGLFSQLVVNQSQQAVFFKGGAVEQVFEAGTHTLNTLNIPLVENVVNLPFGGESPFKAEVWFVNKAFTLDAAWATPTPIQLQDPGFGIFAPVSAHGRFGLQIEDAVAFLAKLVGTLPTFTKAAIAEYFKGLYVTRVKDALSTYLTEKRIGILEMNGHLDELSSFLHRRLSPEFSEYGVRLVNFFVNDVSLPMADLGVQALQRALAKKAEMDIVGFTYVQERSFDTLEGAAKNESSLAGSMIGAGLGMGMGFGMGGAMGEAAGALAQQMDVNGKNRANRCASCGAMWPEGFVFCPQCGIKFDAGPTRRNEAQPGPKTAAQTDTHTMEKD